MRVRSGLAVLLLPGVLTAQREPLRQPTAIPTDLAIALIAAGGFVSSGEVQILVGDMPGWMSERLPIPAEGVVTGSAFAGMNGVAILQLLEGMAFPDTAFEAALGKHGWKKWAGQNEGGFRWRPAANRPAGSPPPANQPLIYCAGQQTLRVSGGAPRQGRVPYVLRVSAPANFGPCNPPPQPPSQQRRAPLPTLYHPPGSSQLSSPFGFSSDCADRGQAGFDRANFTSAHVSSDTSAQSMLDHYGKQLADSGWTVTGASAEIGRRWRRVDAQGTAFTLRITIATSSELPSCRSMQLFVQEAEKP